MTAKQIGSWRLTNEQKQAIVREYARGDKVAAISQRYGVSVGYPSLLAFRLGATLRRPSKNK